MILLRFVTKIFPNIFQRKISQCCSVCPKPQHLICFKQWTAQMVMDIISSAINLKCCFRDTHHKRLNILRDSKVMILQEVNEPLLNIAVSKAATLLGAFDVNIVDHLIWDHDYFGKVFSYMCDVIFVSTSTHMCVQRFAEQSLVPVLCMRSRTHASIQAMAAVMTILEEFGTMSCMNISYLGPPHPVLNSYLLLCPMLGANIKFKCCCEKCPVSPLLYKASEKMTEQTHTVLKQCKSKEEVLNGTSVVIAGPATTKKDKVKEFQLKLEDIKKCTACHWIYMHTCPRGEETPDEVFHHCNARTFHALENMHFIAAALMANSIKGYRF